MKPAFLGYTVYSISLDFHPSIFIILRATCAPRFLRFWHLYFSNIFDNGLLIINTIIVSRMAKWNRSGNGLLEDFKQLL